MQRSFYCDRKGLRIYVREFLEEGMEEGKFPAVVVSHGFGADSTGSEAYCRILAKAGYAVFSFDFCGGSLPGAGKSDGVSTDMSIQSECRDLEAVLGHVRALPYVDRDHITLMGESMGGFVSALTAAGHPEEVENLILWFPALCIPDHARLGRLGGAEYDVSAGPEVIECGNGMKLGRSFHEQIKGMDPYLEIGRFPGRVLLIQGMKDSVVNYSYAVKAKEAFRPGQCSLQLIRQADHGFAGSHWESAVQSMLLFLAHKPQRLVIQVFLTGSRTLEEREDGWKAEVYFIGYCDCEAFRGSILPGAVDVQEQKKGGLVQMRAEYTLEGIDASGAPCRIHIVNQKQDGCFKPSIQTDSKVLAELNTLDGVALLEEYDGGLTVRIFG